LEEDRVDVLRCVREAFSSEASDGQEEVDIVASVWLLEASIADCDLVAIDRDEVVGYALASGGRLGDHMVPGIAPLAVRPDDQGQGIGTALMRALIPRLDEQGFPLVVLLGDEGYYGRFGFELASPLGVHYRPGGANNPHFQVLPLTRYDKAFVGEYVYSWES
jgi:putative acetyltransferase